MSISDHDLSDERLIPIIIDLHKFADVKMTENQATIFLADKSPAERMNFVTAHKQVIGH